MRLTLGLQSRRERDGGSEYNGSPRQWVDAPALVQSWTQVTFNPDLYLGVFLKTEMGSGLGHVRDSPWKVLHLNFERWHLIVRIIIW